jgi:hypothetical protein
MMMALALGLAMWAAGAVEPQQDFFKPGDTVTIPKTSGGKQGFSFVAFSQRTTDPFVEYFFMKYEAPAPAHTVRYVTLQQSISDTALIEALGGEAAVELTLTEAFALFRLQLKEENKLQADEHLNVLYVRDRKGILRTVLIGRDREGKWYLNARALDASTRHAGDRVFVSTTASSLSAPSS